LNLARVLKARRTISADPWFNREGLSPFQSFLRLRLDTGTVAYILATDQKAADEEATRLLERVIREFGDVVRHDPRPRVGKVTLAELARSDLENLRKPTVGRPAPEIEGKDANGRRFTLSEHRGKIVLLVFFADWDEECRKRYTQLRRLVERFKAQPFALLGVECDKDPEKLREATRKGEITWRCWRDEGMGGPIAMTWGVDRLPTVFILDHSGVIRSDDLEEDRLEKAVERLVNAAREKRR
jgi:peroxiredoxin